MRENAFVRGCECVLYSKKSPPRGQNHRHRSERIENRPVKYCVSPINPAPGILIPEPRRRSRMTSQHTLPGAVRRVLSVALTISAALAFAALPVAPARAQSAQSSAQTAANTAPAVPVAAAVTSAAPALPHFDLTDVHTSPFVNQPFMSGGQLHGDRYAIRQATMVNLIANAWSIDNDHVLRGPSWLDFDRFDIASKAPRTTSPDDLKLMLRSLLADRFSLAVHTDTQPMPAFVLTAGKSGPKMKPADTSADSNCKFKPPDSPQNGPLMFVEFECHNRTMAQIANDLRNWAGDYLTNPVIDQTALTGSFDFNIRWTPRGLASRVGSDAITIFDAVDKQLGLKLEAAPTPQLVVYVDSCNEKPTPNAPGLDKLLPPPPPAEFDVAIIKPSSPDTKGMNGQVNNSQINLQGATMQWFITWAWGISNDMIADPPKWLNEDHWDLLAKVAHDPSADGPKGAPEIEFDQLQDMIKKLLGERFGLQVHMEDRPADAYTLVAANPHMKKADPDNRTGCHEGPGPDGKDPRIANPILGRLLTCQNMTMAQFGDQLRILASGYIHAPVLDQTGLTDAYDFTLSFSTAGQLNMPAPKDPNADPNSSSASDPNGALSLLDALPKEIGVKLEKQKRPVQMLVIDHVNQTPTDN